MTDAFVHRLGSEKSKHIYNPIKYWLCPLCNSRISGYVFWLEHMIQSHKKTKRQALNMVKRGSIHGYKKKER